MGWYHLAPSSEYPSGPGSISSVSISTTSSTERWGQVSKRDAHVGEMPNARQRLRSHAYVPPPTRSRVVSSTPKN
eukprot:10215892-Lingulodinium_polyedra.AAC.1